MAPEITRLLEPAVVRERAACDCAGCADRSNDVLGEQVCSARCSELTVAGAHHFLLGEWLAAWAARVCGRCRFRIGLLSLCNRVARVAPMGLRHPRRTSATWNPRVLRRE